MFERETDKFEPSSQTKEAMLYVRKKPWLWAGIRHPGLFGIHGYTVDWILFVLALTLEGIGLYMLYNIVSSNSDTDAVPALAATGAVFFVDLLIAFFHHRFATGINAVLEIEIVLLSKGIWDVKGADLHTEQVNRENWIKSRKRISFILSVMLILIAAGKFGAFFMLADESDRPYGVLAFMAVAYLVTAIIHIRVSGYLMHAVWAWWLHHRDYAKYTKSKAHECLSSERKEELEERDDFKQDISVRYHQIVREPKPGVDGKTVYLLKCKGMLMDSEIDEFSHRIIDTNARSEFVLKAMKLQRTMVPVSTDIDS